MDTTPTETACDRFERRAAAFQRDTGRVAPGKDASVGGIDATPAQWTAWCRENPEPMPVPDTRYAGQDVPPFPPMDVRTYELGDALGSVRRLRDALLASFASDGASEAEGKQNKHAAHMIAHAIAAGEVPGVRVDFRLLKRATS